MAIPYRGGSRNAVDSIRQRVADPNRGGGSSHIAQHGDGSGYFHPRKALDGLILLEGDAAGRPAEMIGLHQAVPTLDLRHRLGRAHQDVVGGAPVAAQRLVGDDRRLRRGRGEEDERHGAERRTDHDQRRAFPARPQVLQHELQHCFLRE